MLSHQFRTIFVHVPKTGGQSISDVFLRKQNLTWAERGALLLRPTTDPSRGPRRLAHLYADEYVGLGHVPAETFAAYLKFAVVRNPWARTVSAYKFYYRERGIAFRDFLQESVAQGRGVVEPRHLDSQTRYIYGADGRSLMDHILRFEALDADFAALSRRIFGAAEPLPQRNRHADQGGFRDYYDIDGRRIVDERYRGDIEAFGYRFE